MRRISVRTLLLASALPLVGPAPGALAQSNTITILQEGTGNTLFVDQSGATDSDVGGLTINDASAFSGNLVINGEQQFVTLNEDTDEEEIVPVQAPGVSLSATTFDPDAPTPLAAQQLGNNNSASVTISGSGGLVGLLQNNTGGIGNSAEIDLSGDRSEAQIGQVGRRNAAALVVSGDDAFGSILQTGDNNDVGLVVSGDGSSGTISQLGSGNSTALEVGGGAAVNYVLQGSNVTFNAGQGVQVISNAASVQITQTAMPGR